MRLAILFSILFLISCSHKTKVQADTIYFNGHIITMDDSMPDASVVIVDKGKIIAVGDSTLLAQYDCKSGSKIDVKQQFLYPGLIDAHCHFYGYAATLMSCNLVGTKSWEEVILKLDSFSKNTSSEWITGRGWDQNDWVNKTFPTNESLNQLFPNRPVMLKRIDGHAVICNKKALDLGMIDESTNVVGGEIIKENGHLTGVLVDNAADLIKPIPPSQNEMVAALQKAEKECFSLGLTTLADAGLDLQTCLLLDSLGKAGTLNIYLYLMLNPTPDGLKYAQTRGILENDHTKICSFKLYGDGALGSRGAMLKQPYCDRKGHSGMLINDIAYFDKWCSDVKSTTKYQVNTHCIGDSANKLLLEIYGKYLKGKNDERWRIEHAQIVDPKDLYLFEKYSIIPSVQPTHATSDGPWAKDRLCNSRMKGAYAYQTLLRQNGYLPLGTDFPVEYLNPLFTFYSAVYRENANDPEMEPFQMEEKLTPLQALKGMTIWAAKACRLEHRKGSIAVGKDADFVIMDTNLLKASKEEVLKTIIITTVRNGVVVN